jgi:hypothetical protein
MLSFRENHPNFNSLKKERRVILGVITEEKTKKSRGTAKKVGPSTTCSHVKVKPKVRKFVKTNQKIRSEIFSIGKGDSASLNSNMKKLSPKFFAHINSRNKRFNVDKENYNLPQLSHRRMPFQQLIETDAFDDDNLPILITDDGKPRIQEIYIFDPEGRRDLDND